ncbi:hypothetical protein M569_17207 [Genlisea aurea]|uniref:Uncharacterized protein n=1 Tax=Genlisea aurea TaxID=192259 RepID=S8BZJ1_9LAMI|nr:hypothetical protein M569_17207 [Genlisea aurea]
MRNEVEICRERCRDEAGIRMEKKMKMDELSRCKLRMRVHGCGLKLESYKERYKEVMEEMKEMDGRYKDASLSYARQILALKNEMILQIAGPVPH